MRRRFIARGVTLAAAAAAAGLVALATRPLEPDLGLSTLYALRGERPAPPEAVVVGLDPEGVDWLSFHAEALAEEAPRLAACLPVEAVTQIGRARNVEDLPRALFGCLFETLAQTRPSAVVVDVHFAGATDPANDAALERGLSRLPRVAILERIEAASPGGAAVRERPARRFAAHAETGFFAVEWRVGDTYRYAASQPDFPQVRSVPRVALDMALGAAADAAPPPEPLFRNLHLYGRAGTVRTVSFLDVLQGRAGDEATGRVVFVGASQPSGTDTRDSFETAFSMPEQGDLAGVELAATAFLNLLHDEPLARLPMGGEIAVAAASGFVALCAALLLPGLAGAIAAAAIGALHLAGAAAAFSGTGLWLPVVAPVFALAPAAVLIALARAYLDASAILHRLLPGRIADALLRRRARRRSEATLTLATTMVVDLIGSTGLAEGMAEAEFNRRMTDFFNRLDAEIDARGGMILKYTGDGVLAVFDAEATGVGHAQAALDAAAAIALGLASEGRGMEVRVGLNSGPVALGEVGADRRSAIDAMGDAVNVAARLEQLSKEELGAERTTVLASETTIHSAPGWRARSRTLGPRRIRGRRVEIEVFEVDWRARRTPAAGG